MISELDAISFTAYLTKPYILDKTNSANLIYLADATGFIYKRNNMQYFVTNLHVVSGRDIYDNVILDSHGAVPDYIETYVSTCNQKNISKSSSMRMNLYDANKKPLWLIHPQYGRKVDVAIRPLEVSVDLFAINDIQNIETKVSVSDDVFVLGYPLSLGSNENKELPIWKRASIASEPSINYFNDGRKAFVIDGTTRVGMSGSPVFIYSNFTQRCTQDGAICLDLFPMRCFNFLGIYSGRLYGSKNSADNVESFLGIVWKKELIDEIIDGNVRDDVYE